MAANELQTIPKAFVCGLREQQTEKRLHTVRPNTVRLYCLLQMKDRFFMAGSWDVLKQITWVLSFLEKKILIEF